MTVLDDMTVLPTPYMLGLVLCMSFFFARHGVQCMSILGSGGNFSKQKHLNIFVWIEHYSLLHRPIAMIELYGPSSS